MALAYVDVVYELSRLHPEREKYNLASQIERAATSIVLNIAEGSTGQSDAEQNRFLGLALRSYRVLRKDVNLYCCRRSLYFDRL